MHPIPNDLPRRYTDMADWYLLITHPDEYAEEATFYARTIIDASDGRHSTLLELGSGAGANAFHYKAYFNVTLTDISQSMLDLSRRFNPESEHFAGDMRSIRLHRTFDAVFVHDAICYMRNRADLRSAMETAFVHLRSGGVALFAPDNIRENFADTVDHGGRDGNGRALRYMIWTSDPDPKDQTYLYEFVYMMHESGSAPRVVHEAHECGLFSRHEWLDVLSEVGFEAWAVPFEHSEEPSRSLEVFVAKKPAD